MKNKLMALLGLCVCFISVYGPNIPSTGFAYAPEMPEELKKLRNNLENGFLFYAEKLYLKNLLNKIFLWYNNKGLYCRILKL